MSKLDIACLILAIDCEAVEQMQSTDIYRTYGGCNSFEVSMIFWPSLNSDTCL